MGKLYDLHAQRLYRQVLFPLLGNAEAAEDALSETFRAAFRALPQYKENSKGLYPWLAKIARNKGMDLHRARAATGRALFNLETLLAPLSNGPASPEVLFEGAVSQLELQRAVRLSLDSLNERYRLAIELRFFHEQSREACAERLGVKLGTFDVLLLRALRAFRKGWPPLASVEAELGSGGER